MVEKRKAQMDDAAFAGRALESLPTVAVPPALEARILADFDRTAERKAPGWFSRLMRDWHEAVWPGAPAWKPASVLALSLAIGLMAGVLVPAGQLTTPDASPPANEQTYTAGDQLPVVNMTEDLT